MALVNYFSSPAHIGRAASLLRTLQEVIEEAVDGQGKSLNEAAGDPVAASKMPKSPSSGAGASWRRPSHS